MRRKEQLEQLKQEYQKPQMSERQMEALKQTVGLAKAENRRDAAKQKHRVKAAAAVAAAALVILPNTSAELAHAMEQIPVLRKVVQVVTFREYEVKTEDYTIAVEIPTIEAIAEDFAGVTDNVNEEICGLCEWFAEESRADALEYRDAFLETGGTLEEWKERNIAIRVGYTVLLQTEDYVSLAVKRTESWNSASAETKLFNLDLRTGEQVSIEDVMANTGKTWYEDNDAVETETAILYAAAIRDTVADGDLEALADLTAYPIYVGLNEGLVIESREELLALEAEAVFAKELVNAVVAAVGRDEDTSGADPEWFVPSRIGFVLGGSDSSANIIFGVVDGQLKITGINY